MFVVFEGAQAIRVSGFECHVTESNVGFSCVVSGHVCLINDASVPTLLAIGQLTLMLVAVAV